MQVLRRLGRQTHQRQETHNSLSELSADNEASQNQVSENRQSLKVSQPRGTVSAPSVFSESVSTVTDAPGQLSRSGTYTSTNHTHAYSDLPQVVHTPSDYSTAIIYAGRDRQPFTIHRHLLAGASDQFRHDAPRWSKIPNLELFWDDEDPHAVAEIIAYILHSGGILTRRCYEADVALLNRCYLLAHRRTMPEIKIKVVDCIRATYRESNSRPPVSMIINLYEWGLHGTGLYRYYVRSRVFGMMSRPDDYRPGTEKSEQMRSLFWIPEVGFDLAQDLLSHHALEKAGSLVNPSKTAGCEFHDHPRGQMCVPNRKT